MIRQPLPQPLTDEQQIRQELADLVLDPDAWLDTPNDRFGGERPIDVIRRGETQRVRDVLNAAHYGQLA